MGSANPFGVLVAGLIADEFLLLRKTADVSRCCDKAAAAYRPDPKCPGCGARGAWREGSTVAGVPRQRHLPHWHRPRALPQAARHLGLLHQAHAPQRPRRVRGRAVRRHPQDGLRVAAPRARHGVRPPGPDRAARHRLGGRDLHQRHRPLQGLRVGAQARPIQPEAVHLRRHRRPQEPRRGRMRPREARFGADKEDNERQEAPGSPLIHDLERAHGVLVTDGGLESEAHRADVNGPVYLKRMEMVNDPCSWLKRHLWRFAGMSPRTCRRISTGRSISSGSTRRTTDGARLKGRFAIS